MISWVRTVRWEPRQYAAVAIGVPIVLLRLSLGKVLGAEAPFILTWVGILAATWVGGLWPALIVAAMGLGIGEYVLLSGGKAGLRAVGVLIYILFALALAVPGEMYRHMVRRRETDAKLLAEMRIRLDRVARLNAMGELAGTLAHELNQPLTAISSYADAARWMLKSTPPQTEEAGDILQKIVRQTGRTREIMARVRGYVTGSELELTPQSLSGMFQEAVEVGLVGAVGDGLSMRFEFDDSADQVLSDRIQLQQVMVNLIRNAAEAMANAPRRELRIGSRAIEDSRVECHVADRGTGISAEVAASLFQPFATDKSNGMGIGLAVSRTIVEGHGGKIWAENNADGGAVFRFTLMRAERTAAP